MQESTRKILIYSAIGISVILMILVIFVGLSIKKPNEKKENKEVKIINNNAKVIHYDGNIYYLNNSKFNGKYDYAISSLPINFDENNIKPTLIEKFSNVKVDTDLYLYNNDIYYYYLKNTYRYNLETKENKLFCEGHLQYINGNKYVSLYDGSLFEGECYDNTYTTKSIKQLTMSALTKVHEDDERIYYISPSDNGNTLLFAAKKEDFTLMLLDKVDAYTKSIEEVTSTEKYVFSLIINEEKYELTRISKETLEKNTYPLEGYNDISLHVETDDKNTNNNLYLYADDGETKILVLEDASSEVKEYEDELKEDDFRNYSVAKINEYICLFKNEKELTRIINPLGEKSDVYLNYVLKIEDKLYYEVSINNENYLHNESGDVVNEVKYETILARTSVDGGESYQINVY